MSYIVTITGARLHKVTTIKIKNDSTKMSESQNNCNVAMVSLAYKLYNVDMQTSGRQFNMQLLYPNKK